MRLKPSPVKERALEARVDLLEPLRATDADLHRRLEELAPDVATVVAYGKILPASLLEIPERGFINVHFSLLPAYRGPAPVQRALMDGVAETGVSVMVLSEGMDEGPVLASRRVTVTERDNVSTLGERLARVGADLLVPSLRGYVGGFLEPVPQDDSQATYAPKVSTEEARIDWTAGAREITNLARALDPEPGAWTTLRGERVKVYSARPAPGVPRLGPGEIAGPPGLVVGTGDVALEILEAQVAGRRRMAGADLARGLRASGERFE